MATDAVLGRGKGKDPSVDGDARYGEWEWGTAS